MREQLETFQTQESEVLAGLPESSLELIEREGERLSLNAGDVLFKEGDIDDALYIVLSGSLEMVARPKAGKRQVLASFRAGDCAGETIVLFHRLRQATVCAATPSEVLRLSLPLLANLFDRHPAVYDELRRVASRRLLSFHLASSPLLADVDIDSLRMLDNEANWLRVSGGETLFEEGDPAAHLYVVACGRLAVSIMRDGKRKVIAHAGRGDCVGGMELLTGERRFMTVRATRDTQLVRLSREELDSFVLRNPQCMKQIAKASASVVSESGTAAPKARVSTIALVPVLPHGLPAGFAETLSQHLSPLTGPAFNLSSRRIEYDLGPGACSAGGDAAHTRLINWLAEYEDKFPCLLLECDPHPSLWTALCMRHADLILIVAPAERDSAPGPLEEAVLKGQMSTSCTRKELVLVHSGEARLPSGTSQSMAYRKVDAHHHIRSGRKGDYQRLARFIADKAVGVVLSGGGARGLAHLGALQALDHCGVPIDLIGGASIGAAVAAHWAMGADVPALVAIGSDFSNNFGRRFLRDLTFPSVALNSARRFSSYLKQSFGNVRIEDLWIPYFCNSSNLTKAEVTVHNEGPLWTCVRASCSIPGLWPPVVRYGELLVDGGVMNNLPVDLMRARCTGPVIAIDVSPPTELTAPGAPHAELSGWPMLWKRLNPFARRMELPHIFNILSRTSQLGSICALEATKRKADLYMQPPTAQVDFFDWKSAHRLIDVAYEHCLKQIECWKQ